MPCVVDAFLSTTYKQIFEIAASLMDQDVRLEWDKIQKLIGERLQRIVPSQIRQMLESNCLQSLSQCSNSGMARVYKLSAHDVINA